MSDILNPTDASPTLAQTAGVPGVKSQLEWRLIRAQAIAGSLFAIFLILHLSNIAVAPFGADAFNEYQRTLRAFYQQPIIEITIIVLPLLTHAIAGSWLFFLRRSQRRAKPQQRTVKRAWLYRLQSWAGLFLLVFIFGHVAATRGTSFFYDVFLEFEGVSFSLWFVPSYFFPYYFLLGVAGFYHLATGLRTIATRRGVRIDKKWIVSTSIVATIWIATSMAAFGGFLFEIESPQNSAFAIFSQDFFGIDLEKPWR